MRATELLPAGSRVVVLAPHLDDATFSLGATIAGLARATAQVSVVTVFAGDPRSSTRAGAWDRRAGFRTEGEAAHFGREEDLRACRIMGARPVWLDFSHEQYGRPDDDDAVWDAFEPLLAGADAVLAPGFPLVHRDHKRLTRLALDRARVARIGIYVEQPYATWYRDDLAQP